MRDLPGGRELEMLALELEAERLGTLEGDDRRLVVAMIERARAIAKREAKAGEAALAPVRAALERLYGPGDPAEHFHRLTQDIRAGRFDPPTARRGEIRDLLWALTLQKLRESNPGFLRAHGLE
ncbi:MAG TPA: DUF6285 domain-containing protein [Stellaceae bacterium]|nr:DUF6285 domain-containing protein [Stellaceae bacterium]